MGPFAIFMLVSALHSQLVTSGLYYPDRPELYLLLEDGEFDLSKAPPNDEQRLLRHIMKSYDRSVRPVFQATKVVSVAIGMTLTHIFNVDEKKQVLSMNVWLEQEWQDERIDWDVVAFGNITQLTVPTRFIWTPDVVLYNNAQDFSHGIVQTNVAIWPTGSILWAPPVKFHSTCKLDVSYFPFDDQICALRFGSWIYDGKQVDVTNRSDRITIDKDSFIENGEWQIVDTAVSRKVNRYPCCPNTTFPDLTFFIHLRRRTLYYLYNIIIPCIMLSILTMMQFWLPCESGEKVTLGLTVLLAYSVFSFNIAENMPETSEVIPLIAIYLMCIMGISAASVTLSVIVLNMRHGGERKRAVPPWLQYFAYRILGRIVCWHNDVYKKPPQGQNNNNTSTIPPPFNKTFVSLSEGPAFNTPPTMSPRSQRHPATLPRNSLPVPPPSHPTSIFHYSPSGSFWRETPSPMIELTTLTPTNAEKTVKLTKSTALPSYATSRGGKKVDVEEDEEKERFRRQLLNRAARLVDRMGSTASEDLLHEWRNVSRIFDQFFFGLIFTVTMGVTVGMLILAPRFSNQSNIGQFQNSSNFGGTYSDDM